MLSSLCTSPIPFYLLLLDFLLLSSPLSYPHTSHRLSGTPPQAVIFLRSTWSKWSSAHLFSVSHTHTQTIPIPSIMIYTNSQILPAVHNAVAVSPPLPYFIVEFYFLPFVVLHIIKLHSCLLKLLLFMFCVLALVVSSSNNCLPKRVKNWVKAATHKFKSEPLNGLDTALYSPL